MCLSHRDKITTIRKPAKMKVGSLAILPHSLLCAPLFQFKRLGDKGNAQNPPLIDHKEHKENKEDKKKDQAERNGNV